MNLYDRALRKRLRAAARAALRESSELWCEYKRVRKAHRFSIQGTWLWWLFALLFLLAAVHDPNAMPGVLLLIALWTTGQALRQAADLLGRLGGGPEFVALAALPMRDRDYFLHQWARTRRQAWGYAFVFAAAYSVTGLVAGLNDWRWLAVPMLAWLQGECVVALATMAAAFVPHWPLDLVGGIMSIGAWGVFVFRDAFLAHVPRMAQLAFPAGWTNMALLEGVLAGDPWAVLATIPAILLIYACGPAARWAARQYEMPLDRAISQATAESHLDAELDARLDPPPDDDFPELEARVIESERDAARALLRTEYEAACEASAREMLREPGWRWEDLGFIERCAGRWFTPRERIIAAFMEGAPPSWTGGWRFAAALTVLGVALIWLAPWLPGWVHLLPAILATLWAFGISGGYDCGFAMLPCGNQFGPRHSFYPVGYAQMSRIFLKTATLRALFWLPLATVHAASWAINSNYWGGTALSGALVAVKAVWIALAFQPLIATMRFAGGTDDLESVSITNLTILLIAVLPIGLGLAGAIFFLYSNEWTHMLLALGGLHLGPLLFYGLYGWVYHRGRIDLLRKTPPTS